MNLFQTVKIKKYNRIGYISAIFKGTNKTTNVTMYCISEFDENDYERRREADSLDRLFRWREDELQALSEIDLIARCCKMEKALKIADKNMQDVFGTMEYAFGEHSTLHHTINSALQHS